MADSKCILPHKDVHITTFIANNFSNSGLMHKPVVELGFTKMTDGTFWSSLQLNSRKDALTLANAILEAAEFLPENS
jgi:hypothetical protein